MNFHYLKKSKFKKGDILRTSSGFEFVLDKIYRISIFAQVYCSGYGTGISNNIGLIAGIKEEDCTRIGYCRNWSQSQKIRNKESAQF